MIRYLPFILLFLSCSQAQDAAVNSSAADTSHHEVKKVISYSPIYHDTTLLISGVEVDVLIPKVHKADMLVLPGWNFSRKKAFGAIPLTGMLLERGYRLIMPEMGKSVYATNYFPETRKDWLQYPTLTWVTDTMIPLLQDKYGMLREGERNFIAGISTGGRGVALVAARKPVFTAGAALSGDYDQTKMTGDNLMKGVYGEYAKFKERWETVDNPSAQADKINMPLYLGHGAKDKVVPVEQTKYFGEKLHKAHPDIKLVIHIDENAGHEPVYWLSEMDRVLKFFEEM